jgi:hypothetical protein
LVLKALFIKNRACGIFRALAFQAFVFRLYTIYGNTGLVIMLPYFSQQSRAIPFTGTQREDATDASIAGF